jgi:hypothetical protein
MSGRHIIRLLTLAAALLGIVWLVADPGFEPLLASLVGIAAYIGIRIEGHRHRQPGDPIDDLLPRLQDGRSSVSALLSEVRRIARLRQDAELERIAEYELGGYPVGETDEQVAEHRVIEGYLSIYQLDSSHPVWRGDPARVMTYLKSHPDEFKPLRIIAGEPLANAEERRDKRPHSSYLTITRPASAFGFDLRGDPDLQF